MSNRDSQAFRTPLYHRNDESDTVRAGGADKKAAAAGKGREGWDAYRKWMSRVSGSAERRAPLDPAIYSWKGYHNWADKVRQSWKKPE